MGSEVAQVDVNPVGHSTMSPAMAHMQAYPAYLLKQVSRYLGDRVWEIGVGHGQYAKMLISQNKSVLGSDIDEDCLAASVRNTQSSDRFQPLRVDLNSIDWMEPAKHFHADSILCFNVLEHIEKDVDALTNMKKVVVDGAILGLIVPAHAWLYGKMDKEAGHYRRYQRAILRDRLTEAGWQVVKLRYINLLGALGWWYHNRWRSDAGLSDPAVNSQMSMMDRWLPRIAALTDPIAGSLAGLSLVAIAKASRG